jgi:ComEC/Rec2-related protein
MKIIYIYIYKTYQFLEKNILFCISSSFIIGIILSVELYFMYFIIIILILSGVYLYYFRLTHINNILLLVVIIFVCFGYMRNSMINKRIEYNNSFLESVDSENVFYGKVLYDDYKIDNNYISIINITSTDSPDGSTISSICLSKVLVSNNLPHTLTKGDIISFNIIEKIDLVNLGYLREILGNKFNSKYIYSIHNVNILDTEVDNLLRIDRVKIINKLIDNFDNIIPSPHKDFILGLIIGRSGTYNKTLYKQLYITGTTHIISVSGYNITLIISYLLFLSSIIGRKNSLIISFMSIITYMIIVGIENIAVVRATLFGIILILSKFNGRKKSVYNLITFSVMILLYFNPGCYKEISFQLSYASTIGIMSFSGILKSRIGIFPEWIKENIATTSSAILFTMPIILFNFGKVSLLSVIVNICILPLVPIITIGGIVFIILMSIKFPYLKVISLILYIFTDIILKTICLFSKLNADIAEIDTGSSRNIKLMLVVVTFVVIIVIVRDADNSRKNNKI